jgi:assimilatory nitrate reductase catalytic subunit
LHPTTASEYAVEDGQLVTVSSAYGECQVRAEVTREIAPKQLFIPIHWNKLTAKDAKPCDLIAPYTDGASGQPEFKHTPVTLQPCQYQSRALFTSRQVLDLDQLDYWSRQKIEQGYLYRIESGLSVYQLAQLLKSKLSGPADRIVSFESGLAGLQHRYLSFCGDTVSQELYVQELLSDADVSHIIDNFNRPLEGAMESVEPTKPRLAS